MKFVMLVEGATEKRAIAGFLKRWLDPLLRQRVGVQAINCLGNTRLIRKAQDFLESPESREIIAVIGLLDLYGLDIYRSHLTSVKERHDWAVSHLESQVDRAKFRMYFAVHEFEAWILGEPEKLPRTVRDALPGTAKFPEKVDFDQPPAKLLNRLYLERLRQRYRKPIDGKLLFEKLDPKVVVEKCPYLKTMLSDMLSLAKDAEM